MPGLRLIAALSLAGVPLFAAAADRGNATDSLNAELRAFQGRVIAMPLRRVRSFTAQLPALPHLRDSGVAPKLELIAGRVDDQHCVYQLRLHWPGATVDEDARHGRLTLRQTACEQMAKEVSDVVLLGVAMPRRDPVVARVPRPSQVVAAPQPDGSAAAPVSVTTIAIRTSLRERPAGDATVLAKLPPSSMIVVAPTDNPDWYRLHGQPVFIHATSIVRAKPDGGVDGPAVSD